MQRVGSGPSSGVHVLVMETSARGQGPARRQHVMGQSLERMERAVGGEERAVAPGRATGSRDTPAVSCRAEHILSHTHVVTRYFFEK